jgi:anti-sigma regulatory factor (Ser/Thr protein kinase)
MAEVLQSSDTAVMVLEPDVQNVPAARRFVVDAIGTDDRMSRMDAALLTSELVANAVAHASTEVKVKVEVTGDPRRARVEVYDGDHGRPVPRPLSSHAESGRGLAIVDAVADDWGVTPLRDNGKVVWFELALSPGDRLHCGR